MEACDRATMWGSFGLTSVNGIMQSISSVDDGPSSFLALVPTRDLATQEGRVEAQQLWKHESLVIEKIIRATVTQRRDASRQSLRSLPSSRVEEYEQRMLLTEYSDVVRKAVADAAGEQVGVSNVVASAVVPAIFAVPAISGQRGNLGIGRVHCK